MMTQEITPKFVAHRTINDGWTYVTVSDSNCVIGIKAVPTKIFRAVGVDGKAIVNPTGLPVYSTEFNVVTKVLSKEEWDVLKQMEGID